MAVKDNLRWGRKGSTSINGLLQQYKVSSSGEISAGDFVKFVNNIEPDKGLTTVKKVKNGEIEIGTISMSGYPGEKVYGVLNGVCTINGVKQMCALRVDENVSGETAKVYLLLNDTTILTSTAQTLSVEASGTLKHNCNY